MPTKILAIDDSKTMRLAVKITFAAEDAEVVAVSKGNEAVARAKQMPADVVLVDSVLSADQPSGWDVCRQLKNDPGTSSIPVLMMVSNQGGMDASKLAGCGADGHVTKPFETQELIDKVTELLRKSAGAGPRPAAAPMSAPAPAAPRPVAPAAAPAVVPSRAPAPAPAPVAAAPAFAAPRAEAPVAAAAPMATRPAAAGPIPIAVPIPFAPASAPTPGMLRRLQQAQGGGAAAGLDPQSVAALLALSREVVEQVVWEVVPELAEQIIREQRSRSA